MSSPRPSKAARKKAHDVLSSELYSTFGDDEDESVWDFSDAFERASCEVTPLDAARFNKKTLRYESSDKSFKADDITAQSMVMLILYRLDKGIGEKRAARHLSIWNNVKEPCLSDLDNPWHSQLEDLVQAKKIGKTTRAHPDEYCAFNKCYSHPKIVENTPWERRSDCFKSVLHIFAEQGAVQWALDLIQKDGFQNYPFLAACVIRIAKTGDADATGAMADLLFKAARQSDSSENGFGQIATELICNPESDAESVDDHDRSGSGSRKRARRS